MSGWQYFKDTFEIIGILLTGVVAVLVYTAQRQRDRFDKELQKPYLNINNIQGVGWVIMNVGRGPALKVRFADKGGEWEQPVIAYSIPSDTALLINTEIEHGAAIAAVYSDLQGNEYLALCEGDTTAIRREVLQIGMQNYIIFSIGMFEELTL